MYHFLLDPIILLNPNPFPLKCENGEKILQSVIFFMLVS